MLGITKIPVPAAIARAPPPGPPTLPITPPVMVKLVIREKYVQLEIVPQLVLL